MKQFENAMEITKDTVIQDEKVYLSYEDTNVFSSNNLSIINGYKGDMKSTTRDYLIEKLFKGGDGFTTQFTGTVLIIDTEMGGRAIKRSLSRYENKGVDLSKVRYFTVKGIASAQDRIEYTETKIDEIRPEIVIIDGSRDFCINSNDPRESMLVINKLLYWVYTYQLHIVNIVHSVRLDGGMSKTKGTFGSELDNKSETILTTKRNRNIATVKCAFSRDGDVFKPFKLTFDEEGNPFMMEGGKNGR